MLKYFFYKIFYFHVTNNIIYKISLMILKHCLIFLASCLETSGWNVSKCIKGFLHIVFFYPMFSTQVALSQEFSCNQLGHSMQPSVGRWLSKKIVHNLYICNSPNNLPWNGCKRQALKKKLSWTVYYIYKSAYKNIYHTSVGHSTSSLTAYE